MKKFIFPLLILVLLLSGCGKKEDNATAQSAYKIVRVMLSLLDENEEADALAWYREPEEVSSYLTNFYKMGNIPWTDAAVVCMEGARAFELAAVFVNEENTDAVSEALQEYLANRRGSFTGYFPDQASLVDKGLILIRGQCVALIVCNEPEIAKSNFETCFGDGFNARGIPVSLGPDPEDYRPDGRLIYTDPKTDDMTHFDSTAILSAWRSGNQSNLSKKEKQVLEAAAAVLTEWTSSDMSDYEKEWAVYVWLTTHVAYDDSKYEKRATPRTSYEPYGPLVNGKGVCLGYAETFRLLMDMADIECITVDGAGSQNRENHAWNMVRLNGEWYCVDPTWDHNHPEINQDYPIEDLMLFYEYFNVTSQYMADTDHQWDYDNTPEATAEDGGQP